MFPAVPLEEMEAHGKRSEAAMQRAMSNLAERWDTEWLPEIKGFLDHWDTYGLGSASMPDLLDHLKDTLVKKKRLSEIHFHRPPGLCGHGSVRRSLPRSFRR